MEEYDGRVATWCIDFFPTSKNKINAQDPTLCIDIGGFRIGCIDFFGSERQNQCTLSENHQYQCTGWGPVH